MVRNLGEGERQYRSLGTISDQRGSSVRSFFTLSFTSIFSRQIMKHTEQLQQRPSAGPTSDGLNVAEKTEGKAEKGRKCCGGSSNDNEKK